MDTVLKHNSNKTNNTRLHTHVFCVFMVFALLLIGSLWIFQTVLLETFYKQIKTQSLKDAANVMSESVKEIDVLDMDNMQSIVNETAIKNEISIKVLDCTTSTGTFEPVFSVIADQDNILDVLSGFELFKIYEVTNENGGEFLQPYQRGAYTTFSQIDRHEGYKSDEPFSEWDLNEVPEFVPKRGFKHGSPHFLKLGITQELLMAKLVKRDDGKEFLMLFDSVITPMGSTVKTLGVQLIFQSVIILLIAAISAKLLAKKIADPITNINTSAKKLAAGNYDTEFSGEGYLEVSQLSDTLNYTAKELKESDALKRELISNTSHDLRTPLTMIIGYAEVMRDLPGENTPENVQVIIDEAERLTTLVNDMLDLSKLQSGNTPLEITEFNLTAVTQNIIERMRKLTEKDEFVFNFNSDASVYVKADETKITQVIYNFLSNAVNYSEESRIIDITQKVSGNTVRIEITDHGKGIPKDKLPNIWERYYKIDRTHKRSDVGSGIGLSIVKSVLELHNAKYGVITEQSKGSTFWFELTISNIIK